MGQQVLLMKINFDKLKATQQIRPSGSGQSPIKISIQSPVYNSVVRQMSPHNYRSELNNINTLINLPIEVSRFLEKQIEKEIIAVEKQEKKISKTSSRMSINFLQRTSSDLLKMEKQTKNQIRQIKNDEKIKMPISKKPQINSKMRSTLNKKKHKCQNIAIQTQVRHTMTQISQFTSRPQLYSSKVTQKVCRARKQNLNYGQKHYSIYQNLYNEATQRKLKAQMKKTMQNKKINDRKLNLNNNYFMKSKFSYTSLTNRMDTILDNRQTKRKQKLKIDETTGRQLFIPDTSYSKQSYRLYFNSLSKQKLVTKRIHRQSVEQVEVLNRCNSKPNMIDNITIEYFTQIFYPSSISSLSSSIAVPQLSPENPLRKEQFLILHPFLHEIEELESRKNQMETTTSSVKTSTVGQRQKVRHFISKQEFQLRFKKFYKKLSLHDRQVLRRETVNRRKKQLQSHIIKQQNQRVFRPTINARSASLDNLAQGHSKGIYYI